MKEIPAKALESHTAVVGMTGSGKTSTAKLIVEHVVAIDARVCIIDPLKSDWWGLTSSADGKRPGLPFHILGGPRGHIPLHASSGKAIGEIVASGSLRHSILDMADFGPGDPARFFIDFAATLFRHARGVVYLVVEEAHEFAPKERVGVGNENMALYWMKRIATGARSKGIRLVVCTQRIQKLHNDLLSSCDTLLAHRVTFPADQEPIVNWMRARYPNQAKEVAPSLAKLHNGESWVCTSESVRRIQFPKIKTFDNTATPTHDAGAIDVATAAVDQDKLRAIIGDAVKEAEANDPKALKRRIADLEKQIGRPAVDQAAVERACAARDEHWRYVVTTQHGRLMSVQDRLRAIIAAANEAAEVAKTNASELRAAEVVGTKQTSGSPGATVLKREACANESRLKQDVPIPAQTTRRTPTDVPSGRNAGRSIAGSAGGILGGGLKRMMIALAQRPQGLNRQQLGARAGLSSKSGTFDTYLSRARQAGWIRNAGDRMVLTDVGLSELGEYEPLPTGEALIRYWLEKVGGGAARILRACCDAYPHGLTREQLGNAAGLSHSSGTFDTYLSRLRTLELIGGRGEIRASEELFA